MSLTLHDLLAHSPDARTTLAALLPGRYPPSVSSASSFNPQMRWPPTSTYRAKNRQQWQSSTEPPPPVRASLSLSSLFPPQTQPHRYAFLYRLLGPLSPHSLAARHWLGGRARCTSLVMT